MGIIKRIINLFRGKTERAVEKMEAADPDAIYRSAIEEKTKDIKELTELAREMKGLELKEENEIADCEKRIGTLTQDLELAINQNNEAVGAEILSQISEVQAELEVNREERESYANQFTDINNTLEIAKKDLVTLQKEQKEAVHVEKTAKIMTEIQNRKDGISNSATSKALETARNRIAGAKATTSAMSATKEASLDSKLKDLRAKASEGANVKKFQELMASRQVKTSKKAATK